MKYYLGGLFFQQKLLKRMSYEKNLDVVVVDIIGVVPKSIIRIAKKKSSLAHRNN